MKIIPLYMFISHVIEDPNYSLIKYTISINEHLPAGRKLIYTAS